MTGPRRFATRMSVLIWEGRRRRGWSLPVSGDRARAQRGMLT